MSDVHHLTRAAFERLSQEFEELTTVGRIDIATAIERARELGDLSENGDYHAAKDQQGMMEGRIRQLEKILKNCEIVEDPTADDTVAPGMVISLQFDGEDDVEDFFYGHIEEQPNGLQILTTTSPLGVAIAGRMIGEWVEYSSNSGALRVQVKAVREL
jgi:transcription elongation factor GreA